jgi:hypothetical protein
MFFGVPVLIKCKRRSFDCSGVVCWQSHRSCARVPGTRSQFIYRFKMSLQWLLEHLNDVERYALINSSLFRWDSVIIFSELQVVNALVSLYLHSLSWGWSSDLQMEGVGHSETFALPWYQTTHRTFRIIIILLRRLDSYILIYCCTHSVYPTITSR